MSLTHTEHSYNSSSKKLHFVKDGHNRSKAREQVIMGWLNPNDTFTMQTLYLKIRKQLGKGWKDYKSQRTRTHVTTQCLLRQCKGAAIAS